MSDDTLSPFRIILEDDFAPEHYQAIGEFVVNYSNFESMWHYVFANYSGMSDEVSRAVMGGMRLKDVIERTKRVIKANKLDSRILPDIENIEQLLSPITTFRDNLVHRAWVKSFQGPLLINISKAKSAADIKPEPISTKEINEKMKELLKLALRVIPHHLTVEMWNSLNESDRQMMPAPWLDKPEPPKQKS